MTKQDELRKAVAADHAAALDKIERLEKALRAMLAAVCGPVGFAEAVRHNTGLAFPWHSLDAAEALARAALEARP